MNVYGSIISWCHDKVALSMLTVLYEEDSLNTLRPRQNGRRFADDIFKSIFFNEDVQF